MVGEEEGREGEDTDVDLMGRISQHEINLAHEVSASQTSYPCITNPPLLDNQDLSVIEQCCLMEMYVTTGNDRCSYKSELRKDDYP